MHHCQREKMLANGFCLMSGRLQLCDVGIGEAGYSSDFPEFQAPEDRQLPCRTVSFTYAAAPASTSGKFFAHLCDCNWSRSMGNVGYIPFREENNFR
jgi:hypothetical protein